MDKNKQFIIEFCEKTGTDYAELTGKRKPNDLVEKRAVLYYYLTKRGLSIGEISKYFSDKTRSGINCGLKRYERDIKTFKTMQELDKIARIIFYKKTKKIYLASSYSSQNKETEHIRHLQVLKFVRDHQKASQEILFSPIIYGVALIGESNSINTGFLTWKEFNYSELSVSDELWVLKLDGWEDSEGVQQEIKWAGEIGIKIKYEGI